MTAFTHIPSPSEPRSAVRTRLPGLGVQVLLAMVAGLALGLVVRSGGAQLIWLGTTLDVLGSSFVQLLKVLVPPLVVTAIIASISDLGAVKNGARLAGRTLSWFAITAGLSVSIGLAIGTVIEPGRQSGVNTALAAAPGTVGGWTDFLKSLIPSNILGLSASTKMGDDGPATALNFNVLQLVVLSIVIGIASVRAGKAGSAVTGFMRSALAITRILLGWVLRLTPIGTLGLFGSAVARYGWDTLASLGWFAGSVYLGLALVLFGLYPAVLIAKSLSVRHYFQSAWPAIQLGFVSRSSIGTLPVTEEQTVSGLGVPRSYAAFAVPLGATTKMDGCASIYPAIASLFVAQYFGVHLGLTDYLLIALVSVLGSAATAGVTGAMVMLTLTLSTLGLPLEGAGLLLAIDPIIDMGRTAVNVAGQMLVPYIVAAEEGMLDRATKPASMGAHSLDPARA